MRRQFSVVQSPWTWHRSEYSALLGALAGAGVSLWAQPPVMGRAGFSQELTDGSTEPFASQSPVLAAQLRKHQKCSEPSSQGEFSSGNKNNCDSVLPA